MRDETATESRGFSKEEGTPFQVCRLKRVGALRGGQRAVRWHQGASGAGGTDSVRQRVGALLVGKRLVVAFLDDCRLGFGRSQS